jgi:hypothetical protein
MGSKSLSRQRVLAIVGSSFAQIVLVGVVTYFAMTQRSGRCGVVERVRGSFTKLLDTVVRNGCTRKHLTIPFAYSNVVRTLREVGVRILGEGLMVPQQRNTLASLIKPLLRCFDRRPLSMNRNCEACLGIDRVLFVCWAAMISTTPLRTCSQA